MEKTCRNCRFSSWRQTDAWGNGKCGLMNGIPVKAFYPRCDSWEANKKEERDGTQNGESRSL